MGEVRSLLPLLHCIQGAALLQQIRGDGDEVQRRILPQTGRQHIHQAGVFGDLEQDKGTAVAYGAGVFEGVRDRSCTLWRVAFAGCAVQREVRPVWDHPGGVLRAHLAEADAAAGGLSIVVSVVLCAFVDVWYKLLAGFFDEDPLVLRDLYGLRG